MARVRAAWSRPIAYGVLWCWNTGYENGRSTLHSLRLLAVSYSFPPMAYPRSIQVARLLGALDASTLVICGSEDGTFTPYGRDETIASGVEGRMAGVIREPFYRSK